MSNKVEGTLTVTDQQDEHIRLQMYGDVGLMRLGGDELPGKLAISAADGRLSIELAGGNLDQAGSVEIRDGDGAVTVRLDGAHGNIFLGAEGADGDLVLKNRRGTDTIGLNGDRATITLGGDGQEGFVEVRDSAGNRAIALDGESGEIHIKNWTISAPDYVFSPEYPLPSLEQVSDHVERHHHLPGVPSAEEIENRGVGLTSFVSTLLRKIEELTLYTLEQERDLVALEGRLAKLEADTSHA